MNFIVLILVYDRMVWLHYHLFHSLRFVCYPSALIHHTTHCRISIFVATWNVLTSPSSLGIQSLIPLIRITLHYITLLWAGYMSPEVHLIRSRCCIDSLFHSLSNEDFSLKVSIFHNSQLTVYRYSTLVHWCIHETGSHAVQYLCIMFPNFLPNVPHWKRHSKSNQIKSNRIESNKIESFMFGMEFKQAFHWVSVFHVSSKYIIYLVYHITQT